MRPDLAQYPDVLLVKEVMKILRISRNSVYRLIETGEIKGRIVAGKYLVPKHSVINYIVQIESGMCYNEAKHTDELPDDKHLKGVHLHDDAY